jgi:hypothetical protein
MKEGATMPYAYRGVFFFCLLAFVSCEADERLDSSSSAATINDTGSSSEDGDSATTDSGDESGKPDEDTGSGDPCDTGTSNQGCLFWAVDLPNVSNAPLAVAPHNQQFAVVVANVSSDVPAEVEIYSGDGLTPIASASVPVDDIKTFELPTQNIKPAATTSDGVAFRIESDVPITAYQFNPLDNSSPVYSNDASLLFPQHVLSRDYTAITGSANLVVADAFSISEKNTGGFVAVVATEDDTEVSIYPTQTLYPGAHQNVSLDRGQVLTAIGNKKGANGNLSGTRVVANKPVAVFSGSVATSEPSKTFLCCADHVEHQMLPLEAWGSSYAVTPAMTPQGDGDRKSLYRISAAFDGTELVYSPAPPDGAPATLDAYETAEVITKEPFVVSSTDPNKPFSVTQFLLSNLYFSSGGDSSQGDPSMIVFPALDQFQEEYVFLIPRGYSNNFVTVVKPAGAEVLLDGSPVSASFSALGEREGTSYQYAHVKLPKGHHVLRADEPVAISVIGYSDDVSYGYPGGSGVKAISDVPEPPI